MKIRDFFAHDHRFAFFHEGPGMAHVDWQPGNGTRYECVFTEMPCGDIVVSRITGGGGQCMRLPDGPPILTFDYFTEKTGIKGSDCAAMLLLISMVTRLQVCLPKGFDLTANYVGGDEYTIVEDGRDVRSAA